MFTSFVVLPHFGVIDLWLAKFVPLMVYDFGSFCVHSLRVVWFVHNKIVGRLGGDGVVLAV